MDDRRLHWVAELGGKRKEWDAEIFEQVPDHCIAWRSISGARNAGTVSFQGQGDAKTLVTLRMDYEPEGAMERFGDSVGFVSNRIERDLARFKNFIETRGHETGAWRGEIHNEPAASDEARTATSKRPGQEIRPKSARPRH